MYEREMRDSGWVGGREGETKGAKIYKEGKGEKEGKGKKIYKERKWGTRGIQRGGHNE
jgi:hypothetical protein